MQKLIFINRYFFPDHSATSQMLTDLAFGLAEQKDLTKEIHILTSRQRYDDPNANLPAYESIKNVHIHRVWTSRFGRQNLLGRAIDYLSFYKMAGIKLFFLTKKNDILIAKTDPPLISVIAALIARLKRAELINWLQDLFPEVAAELGVKFARGLPYKILKSVRNKTLHQARMNIAIGELMADRLKAEGIPDHKITVIHNWADGEQIKPVPHKHNPLRKKWGLDGKFVIGYSGNLGRSHDFTAILDAARALQDKPEIQFLFIGGGAQLPKIQKECAEKGLKNVMFKPYQPREMLDKSLSVADVHLVSLKPELEGLIVPSKFYGILAAGRPVIFIGDISGELANVIQREQCGQVVRNGITEELFFAVNSEIDKTDAEKNAIKIRAIFDERHAKDKSISQFRKFSE